MTLDKLDLCYIDRPIKLRMTLREMKVLLNFNKINHIYKMTLYIKTVCRKKPGGKNDSGKKAWWKKSLVERKSGVF